MSREPLDHLRSRKKATYRKVALPTDSDLAERYQRAKAELAQAELQLKMVPNDAKEAQRGLEGDVEEKQERAEQLRKELEETLARFEVRSIGPKAYDKLVSEHPPTQEQRRQAKKDGSGPLLWNEDTFQDALIAATCWYVYTDEDGVEQKAQLTEEFVKEMNEGDQWSRGDLSTLFQTAFEVNAQIRRTVDLGNA